MRRKLIRWYYTLSSFRDYARSLNNRVDVENVLRQVAAGKRPPLTPKECGDLADKLFAHMKMPS